MVRTAKNPANGTRSAVNPFARLVEIVRQNDELLDRVETLSKRLSQARGYAADPLANRTLAATLIDRARANYAEALGDLKANRIEAFAILRRMSVDGAARSRKS